MRASHPTGSLSLPTAIVTAGAQLIIASCIVASVVARIRVPLLRACMLKRRAANDFSAVQRSVAILCRTELVIYGHAALTHNLRRLNQSGRKISFLDSLSKFIRIRSVFYIIIRILYK